MSSTWSGLLQQQQSMSSLFFDLAGCSSLLSQVDFFEWETMIDSLEQAGSDLSPRNSPQLSPSMKKSLTTPKKQQ